MFSGIDHFAIASPDPKRLADWYVQTLDFTLVFKNSGAYFVEAANGFVIEIIPAIGERPDSELKTPGMRHVAISVDDFDQAYRRLQEQDVPSLQEPFEAVGNRLVFFTDLDGNILHLIKRAKPLKAATMDIA